MKLVIEFNHKFELEFDIFDDRRIARRWVRKVKAGQRLYDLDDPKRFYGFDDYNKEEKNALKLINECIDAINSYRPVIKRKLNTISDQDTLNYLHHIFEVYHGQLDQQDHSFWNDAPEDVRKELANLNLHVHRCESVYRNVNQPKFVCTWFGLPKKHTFDIEDYQYVTNQYEFGTVYINYVEIGKTLFGYFNDDELGDQGHAGQELFQPYNFFSADFVVRFHNIDPHVAEQQVNDSYEYFKQHCKFFESRGYSIDDPCLKPGHIPVAKLNTTLSNNEIFNMIKDNQLITKVYFK